MAAEVAMMGSIQPLSMAAPNRATVEDVLYANLVLLGMDIDNAEKKYGCPITPNMFHAPNVKAMEATLYFLLSKVSNEARDAFRVLWPISDKKQARGFKTTSHDLLCKLEKEGCLPAGSIRLSHLQSASGDRLYNLLWHLSTYAMRYVLESEKAVGVPNLPGYAEPLPAQPPQSLLANLEVIRHVTQLKIHQQTTKFVNLAQTVASAEKEWHELAKALEAEYRAVSKRSAAVTQQTRDFEAHCRLSTTSTSIDAEALQEATEAWNALVELFKKSEEKREMVDSILEKRANTMHLDAKQLKLYTNALPTNTFGMAIEDEQGKLDLVNLTRVWTGCLQELHTRLGQMTTQMEKAALRKTGSGNKENKDNSDPLSEMTMRLDQLSAQHLQYTTTVRNLIAKLRETLPETHESIAQLQQAIANSNAALSMASSLKLLLSDRDGIGNLSRVSSTPMKGSLGLIPPTPRGMVASKTPSTARRPTATAPSSSKSKLGSISTPSMHLSSRNAINQEAAAMAWINEYDESLANSELNTSILRSAFGPQSPAYNPSTTMSPLTQALQTPGAQTTTPSSKYDDSDSLNTSTTLNTSISSSSSSSRQSRTPRTVAPIQPSAGHLSATLELGLSPLRIDGFETLFNTTLDDSMTRPQSPKPFKQRNSPDDAVAPRPLTQRSASPASEFIRLPSSGKRSARASLELSRSPLEVLGTRTPLEQDRSANLRSPFSASSPVLIQMASSPSTLAPSSSQRQLHQSSPSIGYCSPMMANSPQFSRLSVEQDAAIEQQRRMDELAEQIVDIMGAATNISSADVARHTMALLGVTSPRLRMASSTGLPRASPGQSMSMASPSTQQVPPIPLSQLNQVPQKKKEHAKSNSGGDKPRAANPKRLSTPIRSSNAFAQVSYGHVQSPQTLVEIEAQLASLDVSQSSEFSFRNTSFNEMSFHASEDGDQVEALGYSMEEEPFEPILTSLSPRPSIAPAIRRNPFDASIHENDISVSLLEAQLAALEEPQEASFHQSDESAHYDTGAADYVVIQGDEDEEQMELERELQRLEEEAQLAKNRQFEDCDDQDDEGADVEYDGVACDEYDMANEEVPVDASIEIVQSGEEFEAGVADSSSMCQDVNNTSYMSDIMMEAIGSPKLGSTHTSMDKSAIEELNGSNTESVPLDHSLSSSQGGSIRLSTSSDLLLPQQRLTLTDMAKLPAAAFSLEPYLFEYPTPSKRPVSQEACVEPVLERIVLDEEDDDLLSGVKKSVSPLPLGLEDDLHQFMSGNLSGLISESPMVTIARPTTTTTGRQRLNLSINPEEDSLNASTGSTSFERIKKVLDFGV